MFFHKFEKFSLSFIRLICILLIGSALVGSLFSDVLSLTTKEVNYNHYGLFTVLIVIFSIFIILLRKNREILFKHLHQIFWLTFIFFVAYQFFILSFYQATPRWDAIFLLGRVKTPHLASQYLSNYSNNRFYFFFNLYLSRINGSDIVDFQRFNIFLISCSSLLISYMTNLLFRNREKTYFSGLIFMFIGMFQPLFMVPYTDTYCIPFVLLGMISLLKTKLSVNIQYFVFWAILAGLFTALAFLMRPSSVVYIIAFIILGILGAYKEKILKTVVLFIIVLSTMLATIMSFQVFVDQQKYVTINHQLEVPFTHFLLLGSHGDEDDDTVNHGVWNAEDVKLTMSQPSTKEMKAISWAAFLKRTKARGLFNSLKFYLIKYRDTTDAGAIGFHRDGLWLEYGKRNSFYDIFAEKGKYRPIFNVFCQLIWVFLLLFILIDLMMKSKFPKNLLALTIVGGLLFLLLFESGGTKYLLQYIPWFCVLGASGFYHFLVIENIFEREQR